MAKNAPIVDRVDVDVVDAPEEGTIAERKQQTLLAHSGIAAQIATLEEAIQTGQQLLAQLDSDEAAANAAVERAEASLSHSERRCAEATAAALTPLSDASAEVLNDRLVRQRAERDVARTQVEQARAHAAEVLATVQAERLEAHAAIADAQTQRQELERVLEALARQQDALTAEAGHAAVAEIKSEVERFTSARAQAERTAENATTALGHLRQSLQGRLGDSNLVHQALQAFPPERSAAVEVLDCFERILDLLEEGGIHPFYAANPDSPRDLSHVLALNENQVAAILKGHGGEWLTHRHGIVRDAQRAWEMAEIRRAAGRG